MYELFQRIFERNLIANAKKQKCSNNDKHENKNNKIVCTKVRHAKQKQIRLKRGTQNSR